MRKICKASYFLSVVIVVCVCAFFYAKDKPEDIQASTEVDVVKPVDVVLTVDTSASMGNNSKLIITRNSASVFLDSVIASTPDASYYSNAYHQVGLVSFNTNIDSESLNSNLYDEDPETDDVKSLIEDTSTLEGDEGIFAIADGQRKTAKGIVMAENILTDQYLSNSSADRVMILITDGFPSGTDTIETAKDAIDSAKDEDIRVIAIGLGMDVDIVTNEPTMNTSAEDFIKYLASSPGDCFYVNQYYFDNPDETLINCNSISSADLSSAMEEIFDMISSTMFFDSAPTVSTFMSPNGPLFPSDQFYLQASSRDDIGFKEFYLEWALAGDWNDESLRERIYCSNLSGTIDESGYKNISVSTGQLGPFDAGTEIRYQAVAKDASDNEVTEGPISAYVASAALNVPDLYRNYGSNTIYLNVADPSGSVYTKSSFYITITSPDTGERIENVQMTKSSSSGVYTPTYYYVFEPSCSWASGYTIDPDESYRRYADDISLDVKVKAYDSAFGMRSDYLVDSYDNNLTNYYESSSSGNCSNLINDDCDFYVSSGEPIIDSDELLCDTEAPVVNTFRTDPDEDYYEVYNDETSITLESLAYDDAPLLKQTIYYMVVGSSGWVVAFDCNDEDLDGLCDEDSSKSIGDISLTISSIFPLTANTTVKYYSTAVDSSGNYNVGTSEEKSFIVKSEGCDGKADLEACLTDSDGICCGGVCNASASNEYDYDLQCAMNSCEGTTLKLVPDTGAEDTACATDEGYDNGCFAFTPSSPAYPFVAPESYYGTDPYDPTGCEERSYTCEIGKCVYSYDNRHGDGCADEYSYVDYECSGDVCSETYSWEDSSCDSSGSWTDLILEDSDGVILTGAPEVLDTKTGPLKIIASVMDMSGVAEYKIQWRINEGSWQSKSCGACAEDVTCSCSQEIGPFIQNDFIEYFMWSKDASPNSNVSFSSNARGLNYKYYSGYSSSISSNTFRSEGIDMNLDHNWGGVVTIDSANSAESLSSYLSIVWEGFIVPDGTSRDIYVETDDGIRIYLNNTLPSAFNHWANQVATYHYNYNFGSVDPVPIKIQWYEYSGNAKMRLGWIEDDPAVPVYPIPSSNLIAPYALTVRDDDCYDIDPSYNEDVSSNNEVDVTDCSIGADNGICCGGYCDTEPEESGMSEECRVDSCSGSNWIYDDGNTLGDTHEGEFCGDSGTCFEYYTGCQSGNKCSSGYCVPDASSIQVDSCSGNIFTDVGCYGGSCGTIAADLDCSLSSNSDGDSTGCNCDCNGYDVEEREHSSLSFDGSNDYLIMGSSSSLNTVGDYSISMWVYNRAGTSSYPTLLNRAGQSSGNGYFWIYTNGTNENTINFQYSYSNYSSTGTAVTSFSNALGLNEWNYVTFTFDNDSNELKLFIDGEQFGTTRVLNEGVRPVDDGTLYLGNYYGKISGYKFYGYMDDVKIYGRTLYDEEVRNNYEGISNDADLIAHWAFDEGTGTTLTDSSGNGNTGYFSNTGFLGAGNSSYTPSWSAGVSDTGLTFDGNDYVDLGYGTISITGNQTIEMWVKPGSFSTRRNPYAKAYGGEGTITQETDGSLTYYYGICGGNCGTYQSFNSGPILALNQWHHIVLVRDLTNMKLYWYKNGALVKSANASYSPAVQAANYNTYFGKGYVSNYVGSMDEIRIYRRAISESEVAQHYQGLFVDEANLAGHWSFDEGSGGYALDDSETNLEWKSYSYDETGDSVADLWKTCTDLKDNDCDGYSEEDESLCDGTLDYVGLSLNNTDSSEDSLFESGSYIEMDDIDIQDDNKNLTITGSAFDRFGIKETKVQWTTDNWENVNTKTCGETDTATCQVCIDGGQCYNESSGNVTSLDSDSIYDENRAWAVNEWTGGELQILDSSDEVIAQFIVASNDSNKISVDDWGEFGIPSVGTSFKVRKNGNMIVGSELYAEQILQMRVCAWDWSENINMKCDDNYYVHINNSNEKPELSNLHVSDPTSFCNEGLAYKLSWNYDDYPYGEIDELSENVQSYYTIQIKEVASESEVVDWSSGDIFEKTQPTSVHFFNTNDSDFDIDYDKIYKWRVKAADSAPSAYMLESDWVESSESITTLEFSYPSVDFSVIPDCTYSASCESESCSEVECSYGETINFHSDSQIFAECINDDDCQFSNKVSCDTGDYRCESCSSDGECTSKFGDYWFCNGGTCQQVDTYSCDGNSGYCTLRDYAKCNSENGLCEPCSDDAECKKFNTGDTYYCESGLCASHTTGAMTEYICGSDDDCREYNSAEGEDFVCNAGVCEDYNYRRWYFGDVGDLIGSTEPDPDKIYVISEADRFKARLYVQDIFGNECFAESWLYFGGKKYPTWNEVSPEE